MSTILECRALKKRYGTKEALCGVDLTLETGRIVGLLGPNGSGKTTLIKLACGLLTPSGGEIRIDGKKPSPETNAVVSYLPERIALPLWMTAQQAMDFYGNFYADFRRDAAEDMVERLRLERTQTIRAMSKGTREKLQLILTMARAAKLYLLDEPLGGVDPASRDYILRTILTGYREDATVLFSTHLIADVEAVLDEAVFLREGGVLLHEHVDAIREERGKSVDQLFRELFAY